MRGDTEMDKRKYKIEYMTEWGNGYKFGYASDETELRIATDALIGRGYYIKSVTEWNKYQHRYMRKQRDYKALYNSKQSDKNLFKMALEERA